MKGCNPFIQKLSEQEQFELRALIHARFARVCNALDEAWSEAEKAEDDILHTLFCQC